MADGDTIYAISDYVEGLDADINVTGTLASRAMEAAIINAVTSSRIPDSEFLSNL